MLYSRPSPTILWRPLCIAYFPSHVFQFLATPLLCPPLPTVFVWLNIWLLNDMVDLNFLNFDTLVPEAPCFVFYATRSKVYCWFVPNDMTFASTLIWYHTRKQIYTAHTETNRPTHKYILIAPVTYLQQLSILHIELITHWYQKFITEVINIFAFQKLLIYRSHISDD